MSRLKFFEHQAAQAASCLSWLADRRRREFTLTEGERVFLLEARDICTQIEEGKK